MLLIHQISQKCAKEILRMKVPATICVSDEKPKAHREKFLDKIYGNPIPKKCFTYLLTCINELLRGESSILFERMACFIILFLLCFESKSNPPRPLRKGSLMCLNNGRDIAK